MIRWAGRLIVAIGVGHMLIGLALTAPHHVDAWFSGAVWDDNLAHMSAANGAYWLTFGSFGVPQTVIGLMVLWLDRRGIVPPSFIARTGGQCRDLRHDLRPVLAMAPSTCSRPPCCWPVPAPPAAAPPLRYERHRKATQLTSRRAGSPCTRVAMPVTVPVGHHRAGEQHVHIGGAVGERGGCSSGKHGHAAGGRRHPADLPFLQGVASAVPPELP
jgi:hypothetical protein